MTGCSESAVHSSKPTRCVTPSRYLLAMTTMPAEADEKRMRLRYAGVCHRCGRQLPAGESAIYERTARRVRCLACLPESAAVPTQNSPAWSVPIDQIRSAPAAGADPEEDAGAAGAAGASARLEFERRRDNRHQRIRAEHPRLGDLILALSDEPQSTRGWERGAIGEEMLAARLQDLPASARVLHDRRIPGTRANIDHIVIAQSGVWVIDAKRYKGKRPALQIDGGILRPRTESLKIGGRDGTKLVDGVRKQVSLITAALDDDSTCGVPVHGILCFLEADWPMIGGSFTVAGVNVVWPRLLIKRINEAPQTTMDVDIVAARIARAFPVA